MREADLTLQLAEGVPLFLNRIPAGSFQMGQRGKFPDEEPVHEVTITGDFFFGVFPVTQAQFRVFAEATGLKHENGFPGKPYLPAESMDWDEAKAFCAWLNGLSGSGVPKGCMVDLPTEAEREYACRTGTTTEYYTGDGDGALKRAGWFGENSGGATHPVGALEPNKSGLYDMHGNVAEWCLDGWDGEGFRKRAAGASDPLIEPDDAKPRRVIRGGSWNYTAWRCRSAFRNWRRPGHRFGYLGFRVGLFPGPLRAKQAESSVRVAEPRDEASDA